MVAEEDQAEPELPQSQPSELTGHSHFSYRAMWLINTTTLKLNLFVAEIPDYVILSHTWGEGEVTFDDISKPHAKDMAGYTKISQCCARVLRDGFEWAWVDTCCIDKRSSAETSKAINSMYK
jgi:hypothetical protein